MTTTKRKYKFSDHLVNLSASQGNFNFKSESFQKLRLLEDKSLDHKIEDLKVESVALKKLSKLYEIERVVSEALLLYESNGTLPKGTTENHLVNAHEEIKNQIKLWRSFSSLCGKKVSRTVELIDANESKDVVANVIKDPTLFTDTEFLANGSYGTVYKAKYCGHFEVVIKILNSGIWTNREEGLQSFLAEVKNMITLQGHDKILPILGALPYADNFPDEWKVDQNGNPCQPHIIVMPFMANGTLEDLLEKNYEKMTTMSVQRKFEIIFDICEAMIWIEYRQLLHRDIKPENVFFDRNWTSKIGDVGMSQFHSSKNTKTSDSGESSNVHFSWWTAPEIIKGCDGPLTSKIDVYSCGVVFWQILTDTSTNAIVVDEVFPPDVIYNFDQAVQDGTRFPVSSSHPYLQDQPLLRDNVGLQNILSSTFSEKPEERPSFQQLQDLMGDAHIKLFLPESLCPTAYEFWKKNYFAQGKVKFSEFSRKLIFEMEYDDEDDCIPVLEHFLSVSEKNDSFVTIEKFSNLIKWFGTMKPDESGKNLIQRMISVVKQPWFFGELSDSEAEEKMLLKTKGKPVQGDFFVRLNNKNTGFRSVDKNPFIITRVVDINPIICLAHSHVYRDHNHYLIHLNSGIKSSST
eukprot:TRINITY_DN2287_c0_g1_i5.p1 TRINITY_DN2287_c0_g1~~TRINITY_DN2287_c0_g1_i5.p1  ORF type:complete len:632 (-),score=87.16 TRINITY_DN2287_c0_g1_i5:454-2349(-)